MPMSNPWHLASVIYFTEQIKPKKLIDIGIGLGTYGFMLRQYLDISKEELSKKNWQTRIDGIEIFKKYKNPIWDYYYNKVEIANIKKHKIKKNYYDLALMNDVIEHFKKRDALNLLNKLLKKIKTIIITTPAGDWPQGTWAGNRHETHFSKIDGNDLPNKVIEINTTVTNLFILTKCNKIKQILLDTEKKCPRINPKIKDIILKRILS